MRPYTAPLPLAQAERMTARSLRSNGELIAWSAGSIFAGVSAALLAIHHPLWAAPLCAFLALCAVVEFAVAGAWLVALPALLPLLNFSPWTGWSGVDEFDLTILSMVAGAYARRARLPVGSNARIGAAWGLPLGLAAMISVGLWRGVADAGGWHFDWFQGYTGPLNSVRVAKSLCFALLLWPLVRQAWRSDREAAFRRLAMGVYMGAILFTASVLWERGALPGWLNLRAPYRTVGTFWEMHVGGAAIDAYVVLCTPFVAWAVCVARSKWMWGLAALFAIAWTYVCLTTFSRGAYVGVAISLLVLAFRLPVGNRIAWLVGRFLLCLIGAGVLLGVVLDGWGYGAAVIAWTLTCGTLWLWWRARSAARPRSLAAGLLALALLFEAVVALGPDSFMRLRLANNALDYVSRTVHWRHGIDLLHGPSDWLLGLGAGRLPAHYDRFVPRGEFSGSATWRRDEKDSGYVRLAGPRTRVRLGGRFGLTQRVPISADFQFRVDLRSHRAALLFVRVCESHLLYDRACQSAVIAVAPEESGPLWQIYRAVLSGPGLQVGHWFYPRQAVLTFSVLTAGAIVDIDNVALESAEGHSLVANGDFSNGMARWWPVAQTYFVPWHIDNLYLEMLIEWGLLGAAVLLGVMSSAVWRVVRSRDAASSPNAAFIAAPLCGLLSVGLVSSVLDVPRVALLAALLVAMALLHDQGGVAPKA